MTSASTRTVAEAWKAQAGAKTGTKTGGKSHFVMAVALELLTKTGYAGLTMRQLAERCGMSLSNVQYYFPAKEDLIHAIADRYFGECQAFLRQHFDANGPVETETALEDLVGLFIDHGTELSDMCRVFRELWALASRHDDIQRLLTHHYDTLLTSVAAEIRLPGMDAASAQRMASLLLVISEGASIVSPAIPMTMAETKTFFTGTLIESVRRQP